MFKTNQYFEGAVVSIALQSAEGTATLGVMKAGEYEFGTTTIEYMTVISGELEVLQPGTTEWKTYSKFETFVVEKNVNFKVRCNLDTPYYCLYK